MHLYWKGPRKCFQCVSEEENVVGCPRIDHERSIKSGVLKNREISSNERNTKRRKSPYKCSQINSKTPLKVHESSLMDQAVQVKWKVCLEKYWVGVKYPILI